MLSPLAASRGCSSYGPHCLLLPTPPTLSLVLLPLGPECELCHLKTISLSTLHSFAPAVSLFSTPVTALVCLGPHHFSPQFLKLSHPHPLPIILYFVAIVISLNIPLTIVLIFFVRELQVWGEMVKDWVLESSGRKKSPQALCRSRSVIAGSLPALSYQPRMDTHSSFSGWTLVLRSITWICHQLPYPCSQGPGCKCLVLPGSLGRW